MGTIFAPTYATLSMGYFEIKLYSVWTFKYGELLVEYIKENWNRFLDDCYTVLRSSQLVLKSYYSLTTQLILQCSSLRNIVRTRYHFQIIKRNENGIWMNLYNKPTDTQRCLSFTSSHPSHSKQCPAFLARRIAENNAEKLKNLENLKSNLLKYHDSESLTKQGLQKALSIPQKNLRKPKKRSHENILPFTQHVIQITLIFTVLLNPRLIV